MRFLADESCDSLVVRRLRDAGHDVAAIGVVRGIEAKVQMLRDDQICWLSTFSAVIFFRFLKDCTSPVGPRY
jgi:hypothetical protein